MKSAALYLIETLMKNPSHLSSQACLVGIKHGKLPLAGRVVAHSKSASQQQRFSQLLLRETGLGQILQL